MIVYLTAFIATLAMSLAADVSGRRCRPAAGIPGRPMAAAACGTDPQGLVRGGGTAPLQWFSRWATLCAPLPMLFILCARYDTGYDYAPTYLSDYRLFRMGESIHSDFGFDLFYSVSQFLSDDPQVFFAITGATTIICAYMAMVLMGGPVTLSVLVFILDDTFFRTTSMISQFLAISLFLLAFALLMRPERTGRQRIAAYVIMAFASTVHVSGVVVTLTLAALDMLRPSKRTSLALAAVFPCAALILHGPLTGVINAVYGGTRFSAYAGSVFQGQSSYSALLIETAFVLFMGVVLAWRHAEATAVHGFALICESMALTFAIFQSTVPLMYRMGFYFAAFHILTVPVFVRLLPYRYMRVAAATAIVVCLACWLYLYPIRGNYDEFLPYTFAFDHMASFA